ncbi:IS66 family transposase, partial [Dialister invisus]
MAKVYTKEELNSFSRETLMAVILSMQDQISQLNTNMERLIEQIADANNKRYGRSSEKLETISGQMELELIFNEAEALTETLYVVEPAEEDVIQPRHRKSKGKREADLKDLPVEVISHTLSEEKLRDVFGTDGWKQLPDEIYKRVRVQPAVYTVEEHHVAVYAGRDNQTIIKADRPKDLLRNSLLTPSLAASIMNAKYVNGLPLYRISQEFLRNDIHISRQVMANWMIQCADRYLGILYDRLHR